MYYINCFLSGKGLFAKTNIPSNTVLGVYPGDHISKKEMIKRSEQRAEQDRFVFEYNRIL